MLSLCVYGQGVEKVKDSIDSKTSYNSIIDMLRREPGVSIMGSGDDGTMPTMYIRGIGTNSKNFQPLFVVDGVRTEDILYAQQSRDVRYDHLFISQIDTFFNCDLSQGDFDCYPIDTKMRRSFYYKSVGKKKTFHTLDF